MWRNAPSPDCRRYIALSPRRRQHRGDTPATAVADVPAFRRHAAGLWLDRGVGTPIATFGRARMLKTAVVCLGLIGLSSPAWAQLPPTAKSPALAQQVLDCAKEKNPDLQIRSCTQVIASAEASQVSRANAHLYRGQGYANKQQIDRAIADLNEAIRLNSLSDRAYSVRGRLWAAKGNTDLALADLRTALFLNPKDYFAYAVRGDIYRTRSDLDRAVADYDRAIQLNPGGPDPYAGRGLVYIGKMDYERAITDFDRAIQLAPSFANTYRLRGTAYRFEKDYQRAIAIMIGRSNSTPNLPVRTARAARLTTKSRTTIAQLPTTPRQSKPIRRLLRFTLVAQELISPRSATMKRRPTRTRRASSTREVIHS